MIERNGDIWTSGADVICVTTNGMLKRNGELVMGKGIAMEAIQRFPTLGKLLGHHVKCSGNYPIVIDFDDVKIASFPTKNDWRKDSDIQLIEESAILLKNVLPKDVKHVAMSRVGCGNGNLNWNRVKAVLKPILDDRFVVYEKK